MPLVILAYGKLLQCYIEKPSAGAAVMLQQRRAKMLSITCECFSPHTKLLWNGNLLAHFGVMMKDFFHSVIKHSPWHGIYLQNNLAALYCICLWGGQKCGAVVWEGFVFLFLNYNLHDKPKPCISATSFHLQLVITSQSVKTVSAWCIKASMFCSLFQRFVTYSTRYSSCYMK